MKLTSNDINSIAQDLLSGLKVFLNRETLEYRPILDLDDVDDTEFWDEEIEKIENEWTDYIILDKMESRDAFNIMEDFIYEITDPLLKENVIKILSRKSPFANFKAEVESSSHRQKWFEFRTMKYEEYIKEKLDMEDIKYD